MNQLSPQFRQEDRLLLFVFSQRGMIDCEFLLRKRLCSTTKGRCCQKEGVKPRSELSPNIFNMGEYGPQNRNLCPASSLDPDVVAHLWPDSIDADSKLCGCKAGDASKCISTYLFAQTETCSESICRKARLCEAPSLGSGLQTAAKSKQAVSAVPVLPFVAFSSPKPKYSTQYFNEAHLKEHGKADRKSSLLLFPSPSPRRQ